MNNAEHQARSQVELGSTGLTTLIAPRTIFGYSNFVANQPEHIDKPEPRWQALLAFIAVGGIYLALPSALVIGPVWLLPTLILLLLVPTVVSHRTGRGQLNRFLGILISSITTLALIASVILLVRALPSHKEDASSLLLSGGELWLTNVLVFALWYWRLDGGRANFASPTQGVWQPQFSLPANADRENRAHPLRLRGVAPALR